MCDDFAAVLLVKVSRGTEMVGMAVSNDYRMDTLGRDLCLSEASHESFPVIRAR
jgi:hypothetical protein